MDPISQGAFGASFASNSGSLARVRDAALLGCLSGMAPDLDVLIASSTDPLLFLEYHRHFTHALAFIPIGALVCAGALHWLVRRRVTFRTTYLYCFLGYASHGVLDACTTYGTQLFWPFSDMRVAWHNVSVVDPLFTVPVIGLVVAAAVRKQRAFARAALGWAVLYLAFGVFQNQRAEELGQALAEQRGHIPVRLEAKPGFGSLLIWKIVYEYDGRYYVDAVRTGLRGTVYPGANVAKLDAPVHLPWLGEHTVQAADIERFRWFSNDYLALDPVRDNHVIDVRYSLVPNEIQPLWGIHLDPRADANAHVDFVTNREATPTQTRRLLDMFFDVGPDGIR